MSPLVRIPAGCCCFFYLNDKRFVNIQNLYQVKTTPKKQKECDSKWRNPTSRGLDSVDYMARNIPLILEKQKFTLWNFTTKFIHLM